MANNKATSAVSPPEQDSGHFGVGLLLGTFLGAVGMFMLGTKSGQDTLQKLRSELERLSREDQSASNPEETNNHQPTSPSPQNQDHDIPSPQIKDLLPVEKPEVFVANKNNTTKKQAAATFPKFKKRS